MIPAGRLVFFVGRRFPHLHGVPYFLPGSDHGGPQRNWDISDMEADVSFVPIEPGSCQICPNTPGSHVKNVPIARPVPFFRGDVIGTFLTSFFHVRNVPIPALTQIVAPQNEKLHPRAASCNGLLQEKSSPSKRVLKNFLMSEMSQCTLNSMSDLSQ